MNPSASEWSSRVAALTRALEAVYKCVEHSRRAVAEAGQALEAAGRDLEDCKRALLEQWPEDPPA